MGIDEFVRVSEEREQTAIVHLVNPDTGMRVDLISVSHIGTKQYYEVLQERLSEEDVVLYEGGNSKAPFYEKYARSETIIQNQQIDQTIRNLSRDHPDKKDKWGWVGETLKAKTRLIGQTEGIDYDNLPENWVLSDLSQDELTTGLGAKSLLQLLCYEVAGKLASLPIWLGGKRIRDWGERNLNDFLRGDEAEEKNRKREEKVYGNLKTAEATSDVARVSILYGAEHMPFIEQRLIDQGYVRDTAKPTEYFTFRLTLQGALKEI